MSLSAEILKKRLAARRRIGRRGEVLACRLLRAKGYVILGRNLRMNHGEIDILARDGLDLVLVEVKTRTGKLYRPVSGWSPGQRNRLRLCGLEYLSGRRLENIHWRMELVEIVLGPLGSCRSIRHRCAEGTPVTSSMPPWSPARLPGRSAAVRRGRSVL